MGTLKPENTEKMDLNDSGCVQDGSVIENSYKSQMQFLDLSDDELLCIFKLCSPMDLKALGHTCPRLGALVCDRTLWTKVDARASPMGHERLHWLLTHCLSQKTTELQVSGYASKDNRCLGIQDLNWPVGPNMVAPTAGRPIVNGVDVEHFLLRMWYPHLPRFAVSPRWPDKREAESIAKNAKENSKNTCTNGTPESQGKARDLSTKPPNDGAMPSSSGASSSSNAPISSSSEPNSSSSESTSSNSAPISSTSEPTSSNSDPTSSNSEPKKMKMDVPSEPEDDVKNKCLGPQFTLSAHLMLALRNKCKSLTYLSLEYCNIDYKATTIQQFPPSLKKLSLRGTRCYNLPLNTSYLAKIQDRLPLLEYLDISECDWVEPASLMPLSKIPNLQELYMRDCKRMTECVAYASLATRYGFRTLRIVDMRGSPLADSEVSAFGWPPRLQELYCAPPRDAGSAAEHSHSWSEMLADVSELEPWELQEPEYYKNKEPEAETMDDDGAKDEGEATNDVTPRQHTCWSHERRIIVIHPNERREHDLNLPQFRPMGQQPRPVQRVLENLYRNHQHLLPHAEHEPSINKRPASNDVLDLVKRPRMDSASNTHGGQSSEKEGPATEAPAVAPVGASESAPAGHPAVAPVGAPEFSSPDFPMDSPGCSSVGDSVVVTATAPVSTPEVALSSALAGTSSGSLIVTPVGGQSGASAAGPSVGSSAVAPDGVPAGVLADAPAIVAPVAGQSGASAAGPSVGSLAGAPDGVPVGVQADAPAGAPANAPAGAPADAPDGSPAPFIRAAAVIIRTRAVPRRRVNDSAVLAVGHERVPAAIPDGVQVVGGEPVAQEGAEAARPANQRRRMMHPDDLIEIDVHQNQFNSHTGHLLVTDAAVLRFGRAENVPVNYIQIGRHGIYTGNEPSSRPDRSNLRVLSLTGYSNITDRSLEHLASAAPQLRLLDLTQTNVTPNGVEIFKALRPDCEVIFSKFGK